MFFLKKSTIARYEKDFSVNNYFGNSLDYDFFELIRSTNSTLIICPSAIKQIDALSTQIIPEKRFLGSFSKAISEICSFNFLKPTRTVSTDFSLDFYNMHLDRILKKEGINLIIEFETFTKTNLDSPDIVFHSSSFSNCFLENADTIFKRLTLKFEHANSNFTISVPHIKISLNEELINTQNVSLFNSTLNMFIDFFSSLTN